MTFSLGYNIATREAGFLSPEATKAAFTGQLTGSSKNKKILIAVENGHPVGKVHVATSGNLTSIFGLVVAREARGRGLAKEVVNSTLFRCSHSGSNHMFCLEVDIENEPAVRAIAQKVLLKTVERSIIAFAIK